MHGNRQLCGASQKETRVRGQQVGENRMYKLELVAGEEKKEKKKAKHLPTYNSHSDETHTGGVIIIT